jgi:predicted permease
MKKRSVDLLLLILSVLLILLGGYLLGRYGPTWGPGG